MSLESTHSELEDLKSQLVSLLKRLRFKDICVHDLPGFDKPILTLWDDNDSFIPTATAIKNEIKYFFEVITSELCDNDPPDKLLLQLQTIQDHKNSNLILIVPYGKKETLSNWKKEIGLTVESIWEINTM